MSYELFCQFTQGFGHKKKGIPCEDYGIKFENDKCKIFVLGDGHGDSNCPRSNFGSHTICEVAVQEMELFVNEVSNQQLIGQLLDKNTSKELVNKLIRAIFDRWRQIVNEDFTKKPLNEKEESEAKKYIEYYKRGEMIEHIYGTTFIAVLMTDLYVLLLQQGDGRCVVFDCNGNATQPIPWDDRCFANVTTSVCDEDAVQSCRYHIIDLKKAPIIACIGGSDGVEDSFGTMEKMYTYYREKLQIACESGIDKLEEHLCETLPILSEKGSQDDITVCGLINRELVRVNLPKMIADNEVVITNDVIYKVQERISSMTPKLEFLKNKYLNIKNMYEQLNNKYKELEEELKSIKEDIEICLSNKSQMILNNTKKHLFSEYSMKCLQNRLEKIKEEIEQLFLKIQNILSMKKKYEDEYIVYKKKYEDFLKMKEDYEHKLKNIYEKNNSFIVQNQSDKSIIEKTSSDSDKDLDNKGKYYTTENAKIIVSKKNLQKDFKLTIDNTKKIILKKSNGKFKSTNFIETPLKKNIFILDKNFDYNSKIKLAEGHIEIILPNDK